jgi:hypothetical protein
MIFQSLIERIYVSIQHATIVFFNRPLEYESFAFALPPCAAWLEEAVETAPVSFCWFRLVRIDNKNIKAALGCIDTSPP